MILLRTLIIAIGFSCSTAIGASSEPIDALHYRVIMSVDLGKATIEGSTQIDFRRTSVPATLRFSRNALTIDAVSIQGRRVSARFEDGFMAIDVPADLRSGRRMSVTVKYHGKPTRGLLADGRVAYTSYFTCDWMICALEGVGDKASIQLELLAPAGTTTYGPGQLVERTTRDGVQHDVWHERRPYSSYVYGFALGNFEQTSVDTGRTKLTYASTESSTERLQRLFAPTPDMLRFFEAKAGVSFPHPSYLQLHVRGSAAQEALGFSIIGEEALAPILYDPQEDWVIAHELAHQWWGNGVTCIDLSHFWLNEGITTFMVAAWKEHRWGRDACERELALQRTRVERARNEGVDHPLAYAGKYPSLTLRRAIQYSKGALFMDRLRQELGDEVSWRALRNYTRQYMGGIASSRDLQLSFERTANRQLGHLFDEWVY